MTASILNIGIIGTGKHGSRYAAHIINDLPEMRLAAICRRNDSIRQQAARWNCAWHRSWKDLVDDPGVDAVISVVPPALNIAIAERCCAVRKPLLMEKPLAVTAAEASAMVSMFQKAGVPLTVAQTLRYNPVIRGLKENFTLLGDCFSFVVNQRLEPSTLPWLEDPEQAGAGVILHTAVHLFDALRFITGLEITRVRAMSRRIYNPGLEDLLLAQIECQQGVTGLVDTSKISPARTGRFEFMGRNGILWGDQIHGSLQWLEGMESRPLSCKPPGPTIVNLLGDWYNFLQGKGENPIDGKEGLAAVKACEACIRSVSSDKWEKV